METTLTTCKDNSFSRRATARRFHNCAQLCAEEQEVVSTVVHVVFKNLSSFTFPCEARAAGYTLNTIYKAIIFSFRVFRVFRGSNCDTLSPRGVCSRILHPRALFATTCAVFGPCLCIYYTIIKKLVSGLEFTHFSVSGEAKQIAAR